MMSPTALQPIETDILEKAQLKLFLKREDLNHPTIQGNKWRKLKYNLELARSEGKNTLLTFGGAFSNHLFATAAAGQFWGFRTIGIVRGERIEPLNPTLAFAENCGMKLHFVHRAEFQQKNTPAFLEFLKQKFGDCYLLPEGGTNRLAVKGCTEIVKEIEIPFDYICTPVGTGGTLAGIIAATPPPATAIGFSVLKNGIFLEQEVRTLLLDYQGVMKENWQIITNYDCGGYAKFTPELLEFIRTFYHKYQVRLDPIYTGKMLLGIFDLAQKGFFKPQSTLVAVHTGGLQGILGFEQRFGKLFY